MLWLVKKWSVEAETALRSTPATAQDLADAAPLAARLGAARLYRRRLLRAFAARTLGVGSGEIGIQRVESGGQRITTPSHLFASVAKRGDWTAVVTSIHPVGVDIEILPAEQPVPLDLLHHRERAALENLPTEAIDLAFLRFWTAREAYLKATGRGLPAELSTVEAQDDPGGERVLLIEAHKIRARAAITVTDECVVAVVELRAPE